MKAEVNTIDKPDESYSLPRSNEPVIKIPVREVDAKLQSDYEFHGFSKESDDQDDDDYVDEDDELLNGDIKGTNETMGGEILTNHTEGNIDVHLGNKVVPSIPVSDTSITGNLGEMPGGNESRLIGVSEKTNDQIIPGNNQPTTGAMIENSERPSSLNIQPTNEITTNTINQLTTPGAGLQNNNNEKTPKFSKPEQSSSSNIQPTNEINAGNTNQPTGAGLQNNNKIQNTGPLFRSSERAQNSQSVNLDDQKNNLVSLQGNNGNTEQNSEKNTQSGAEYEESLNIDHLNADNQRSPENSDENVDSFLQTNHPSHISNAAESNSFQTNTGPPMEATGKPEYITPDQMQSTHEWDGHVIQDDKTSKQVEQGKIFLMLLIN